MKPENDEYMLAIRAGRGDREALAELVERLRARLFGLAYAELRHFEDAQDVVSATLLRVCQGIGALRDPERLRPWADSIARNEARRLAARRGSVLPLFEIDTVDASAGEVVGAREFEVLMQRLDIQAAMRRLPAVHARALELFYLDGWAVSAIASHTDHPVGTVKSWLHYGRRHLSNTLKEYDTMTIPSLTTIRPLTAPGSPAMQEPLEKAVLIHSDLTPEMIVYAVESLRLRGYSTHVPGAQEREKLRQAAEAAEYAVVDAWLGQFGLIVFDETVEGHSALEHIVNLRADGGFSHILIYVMLSTPPPSYTASAYFNAGVSGLIYKDVAEPAGAAELSDERVVILWQRFTERARRAMLLAQEEAKRFGDSVVTTQHILIGITHVPECLGARLLSEKNAVDLEALRSALEAALPRGSVCSPERPAELTPQGVKVIGFAQEEAQALGHAWIGAEHLILGMLRFDEDTAGQLLLEAGLTLEQAREQVRELLIP